MSEERGQIDRLTLAKLMEARRLMDEAADRKDRDERDRRQGWEITKSWPFVDRAAFEVRAGTLTWRDLDAKIRAPIERRLRWESEYDPDGMPGRSRWAEEWRP